MSNEPGRAVGAVVLAAGLSTRMGQPKQLMQWGQKVMVRHVVDALLAGGVEPGAVMVVLGYQREEVARAIEGSAASQAYNPDYADGSMLRSLQVGLRALAESSHSPGAALVALGDQPQISPEIVQKVIAAWQTSGGDLVAPSYQRKRGHPILFAYPTWADVLAAPPVGSPRDWLIGQAERIRYIEVGDDAVLRDIDTPEDYRREVERRV